VWRNAIAGDTGWSNQVSYTTPTLAGVTVDLHYQFGETPGRSARNNVGARASYQRGPLAVAAYVQRVEVNNPLDSGGPLNAPGAPSSQRAAFVGANLATGFAKWYGTAQGTKSDAGIRDRTFQLGAAIPAGAGAVLASWAGTRRDGMGTAGRLTRDTVSIGYDMYLSKRTDLYAAVMADRVTGQEWAHTGIAGIRHRF
jgi:predicted porin